LILGLLKKFVNLSKFDKKNYFSCLVECFSWLKITIIPINAINPPIIPNSIPFILNPPSNIKL